jgi:hypothetical protein
MQKVRPFEPFLKQADREAAEADAGKTWWNGEPCQARLVRVIVGKAALPTWWCASLEGTEREAVEIQYGDFPLAYIDNDAWDDHEWGAGWRKVTTGRGSPQYGHWSLPVERVIEEAHGG